jgi:polyhydroxybutyrate depolymerase
MGQDMKKIQLWKFIIVIVLMIFINLSNISVSGEKLTDQGGMNHKSSLLPGDYLRFIISNDNIRSYRIHIPPNYNNKKEMPLVLVLHGSGLTANSKSIKPYSDMDKKADEEGFIVVYPNGEILRFSQYINHPIALLWDIYSLAFISREWNRWNDNSIDDVGFIRNLISHLKLNLNINSSRIYIMGISGGAMMTYRLGAELSNQIAAIAPIAGVIGGIGYASNPDDTMAPYIIPEPIKPIPVIAFNGLKDEAVPYDGGWKNVFEWGTNELWVYTVSVNESISFWVENNNCNPIPQIYKSRDERIITKVYNNDIDESDVILVTYIDGGHEWYKSPPHEISAIDIMWEFFEQHPQS